MYNEDTDVLFPPRVIPQLRSLRGDAWQALVDQVGMLEGPSVERLAFVLLMARLGNCSNCNSDSFRAMRGCGECARLTIRRFRDGDHELINLFATAHQEIELYLKSK